MLDMGSKGGGDDAELVGSKQEQRNWRGMLIAVLVIILVLCLIVVAIILVTPRDDDSILGDTFTFDDFIGDDFKPRQFDGQWMRNKSILVYRSKEGAIWEHNADTNRSFEIMDNTTFREFNTDIYFVSSDRQYVLIAYDVEQLYRHSFNAKYIIYNRLAFSVTDRLIPFPNSDTSDIWRDRKLQFAGWSSSHSLTFVFENDLYYQSGPNTSVTRVTTSGHPGLVYNGLTDWLYEEEVLQSSSAHWVSPDGAHICFAQFDDTFVPKYSLPNYGSLSNIYGGEEKLAYPKAGDRNSGINPRVKVFVAKTRDLRSHLPLEAPRAALGGADFILNQVTWADVNHTMLMWSNRQQNRTVIMMCDVRVANCSLNVVLSGRGRGWIDVPKPHFIDGGRSYLAVLPSQDGDMGYWKHIAHVSAQMKVNGVRAFVTQGTWDVTDVVGYRPHTKTVFFIGTNNDARTRHLFKTSVLTSGGRETPQCLTCDSIPLCQWFSAKFSDDALHYTLTCEGPDVPWTTLCNADHETILMLEENSELRERLKNKALPRVEYHTIPIEGEQDIMAKVFLPPGLNEEHITQYTTLVETYAGPGSQLVTDKFSLGLHTHLTSAERVICIVIDGRGTGGRGDAWLHAVYRRLGVLEAEDQITGARYLRDKLKYIDPDRVAIWGWSYGGFVTSHVIGHRENDVFTCGAAVAPVTDFRYYDTAYTERYMGLANSDDNYIGYDATNAALKAEKFSGKDFILFHGTADDNVHYQHTAQMTKALVNEGIDFRVQTYCDQKHSLSDPKTSRHLYRTLISFLRDQCWDGGVPKGSADPKDTAQNQ